MVAGQKSYFMSGTRVFILGLCINGETRFFLAASGCVCLGASAGQNPVTFPCVLLKGAAPFGWLMLLQRAREGKRRPNSNTAVEEILVF